MVRFRNLVPPMIRATAPERIVVRYALLEPAPVPSYEALAEGLRTLGRDLLPVDGTLSGVTAAWHRNVLVLGLVRRPVEERLTVFLGGGRETPPYFEIHCVPQALHDAHAAGLGGVLAFTAAAGLAAGAPAGVATLLAGSLAAFVAREHSMLALRLALERLALDLGETLWPGRPGELAVTLLAGE